MKTPADYSIETAALREENERLKSENLRAEKMLIRIQTYLQSMQTIRAHFPAAKIIGDEVLNIILLADSENDTPGNAPEEAANT